MTTSSAKAKGRRLQQLVASLLLERIYFPNGLEEDDCKSVTMGVSGVDIILSPAARRVMNVAIECKNVENLNVTSVFWKHVEREGEKYGSALPVLVSKRNRTEPIATLRFSDLLTLLERAHVTSVRRNIID